MCYCNHAWGSTFQSNLQKLNILQKRIIRIISGTKSKEHTDPLFAKLGIINFNDINKYFLGIFMFRYNCKIVPDVFNGFLKPIRDIHRYNTMSCTVSMLDSLRQN